jgi:hypothetical protein
MHQLIVGGTHDQATSDDTNAAAGRVIGCGGIGIMRGTHFNLGSLHSRESVIEREADILHLPARVHLKRRKRLIDWQRDELQVLDEYDTAR